MKFPFIRRSRHESELARLREKVAKAEKRRQEAEEKLVRSTEKRHAEHQRTAELERLCDARLREMEALQAQVAGLRRSRVTFLDDLSRLRMATAPYQGSVIPVVICIDVEPDARVVELNDPSWRSTERFFQIISKFRRSLSDTAGGAPVRFTWFPRADPQVERANGSAAWALEHFEEGWRDVKAEGDEIGLHMHPWRWDEQAGGWCQDHADEAWVLACLRSSIAAYRKVLGTTPVSYRGGDRYLSNAVVRALEEEGVRLDLTLERMPRVERLVEAERGTGVIPDGSSIPLRAYRPSSHDFRLPDPNKTTGLGMLPLTPYEHGSLSPWLPNVVFEEALDLLLGRAGTNDSGSPTHLAFAIRTSMVDLPYWEDFIENALSLARRVREGRAAFATAVEAWGLATGS